jgi:hypothetical protein
MQYSVPQFVDVEDKVIGPLSIKQFLFLLGGAGIGVTLWFLLPVILAIIIDLPLILLAVGLAFFKVNGVPLQSYIANLVGFVLRPNTRVWKREVDLDKTITQAPTSNKKKKPNKIHLRDVNLSQLTYILDHELAAQAKPRPITNSVETLPVPRPQVILNQNIAVESLQSQGLEEAMNPTVNATVPQEGIMAAEPAGMENTEIPEVPLPNTSKNPNVITSIKPFRRQ